MLQESSKAHQLKVAFHSFTKSFISSLSGRWPRPFLNFLQEAVPVLICARNLDFAKTEMKIPLSKCSIVYVQIVQLLPRTSYLESIVFYGILLEANRQRGY